MYINKHLSFKTEEAIYVEDIDAYINYSSSLYNTVIFTENKENSSKFINQINSKYVMVNTSPMIEQSLDINQENSKYLHTQYL